MFERIGIVGSMISAAFVLVLSVGSASAQNVGGATLGANGVSERYIPTIWTDPDGCEHWVMDDGAEGFMTPHVTPDGIPVCRRQNACGTLPADTLFASGKHTITPQGRAALVAFFQSSRASGFGIVGHTDSQGPDARED